MLVKVDEIRPWRRRLSFFLGGFVFGLIVSAVSCWAIDFSSIWAGLICISTIALTFGLIFAFFPIPVLKKVISWVTGLLDL